MTLLTHEQTVQLIRDAQGGDDGALSLLTQSNSALVRCIAKKYVRRSLNDFDDLYQIGCIGLIKAIRKYDFSYNVRFSTYAVPMIAGEIKRFLRDDGSIKISRGIKENASRIATVTDELRLRLGREPRVDDLAEALQISAEEAVLAMECNLPALSLQKPQFDTENNTLADTLPDPCADEARLHERIWLKEVLSQLEPRARTIIILHYFLDQTQNQIAQRLGISQVQVSRIESKVFERIRKSV